MAEAISKKRKKEEDSFMCPVCLDLLKDPVTAPCGHNFCMSCIEGYWNHEDQRGVYSCPLCQRTFTTRPTLYKNTLVADMVETFTKTRIQASSINPSMAGPGDVECDVCTGRKLKAVKSCLDCLLSYCETHYKVHNDVNPGRKHSVIDATGQLQDRICSHHKKVFEIFCRTDQSCICYLCTMDEHKGHDTVSAAAERSDKQRQLGPTQRRFKQRIQEREKELHELRKAVETLKSSAQTAVEDSERIFTEMIHSIVRRRIEVTELIRAREKFKVSQAKGLLKQLEQEIAELKRRDAELEQLPHTEDHIHFLKTFQSVSGAPESKNLSCISVKQGLSFEAVKKSVSSLKTKLENFCKEEVMKISASVTEVQAVLPPEPTTTGGFLQSGKRTSATDKVDKMGKDPRKPRGKRSSYSFFVRTSREDQKQYPDASTSCSGFSTNCSEQWKAISAQEKMKFEAMAQQDKVRYESEMKNYIPPKGEKKKRFKDPNAPKKPATAFFLFCPDIRPKIKAENPGLTPGDIRKKIGEMWKSSAADVKEPYEKKAAKLKEKYEKDIAAYRTKGIAGLSKKDGDDDDEEEDEDDEDDDDDDDDEFL